MKYVFYPGCSLESTAVEYLLSTKAVARAMGIDLADLPDWICCGSTPAHMYSELLSVSLAAQNLVLARSVGADCVVVACASCYSRLRNANHVLKENPHLRDSVRDVLGEPYGGEVAVKHILELIYQMAVNGLLKHLVRKPINGLKVASYYGCLLTRPPEITGFDDAEDPQSMDRIVAEIGGEPIGWSSKVECCGAALAFHQPDVVKRLSGEILSDAKQSGADMIIVACPLCQSNLDLRQRDIERYLGIDLEIPVLYFTQLVGIALGFKPNELGIGRLVISPMRLLRMHGY